MVVVSPVAAQQQQQQQQRQQQQQQQQRQQQQQQSAQAEGTTDLSDLARHPEKYIGKMVTVEGETVAVLGPHLFVVDEPKWFHLWGGMLVVVPEPAAAVVQTAAPVRVTGTVEKVVLAEAKRRWAFLSNEPALRVDLFEKPVLIATEVTTVAPALVSLKFAPGQQPTGTSGGGAAVTDIKQISTANDTSMVGRRVEVSGSVVRTEGPGFWIRTAAGDEAYVLPANKAVVRSGQTVDVQGRVLETGRDMQGSKNSKGQKQRVYIYAEKVAPK
jgi:hypothetical protein